MGFPWRNTLDNWTRFLNGAGQIVIAVNTSTDDTFTAVMDYVNELSARLGNEVEYTVVSTAIDYADPLFDGLIKNEALRRCNRPYCTLLDIDEVLPLSSRATWQECMDILGTIGADALFLPVIDLFHDENSFKSLAQKWYLHKNRPYLKRGRVEFAARADGSTDITKSDTCELVDTHGRLASATMLNVMALSESDRLKVMAAGRLAYVTHLGWLDKQQRLRQSAFWSPVWNARNGASVEKPLELADLDKIPHKLHGLRHWNDE